MSSTRAMEKKSELGLILLGQRECSVKIKSANRREWSGEGTRLLAVGFSLTHGHQICLLPVHPLPSVHLWEGSPLGKGWWEHSREGGEGGKSACGRAPLLLVLQSPERGNNGQMQVWRKGGTEQPPEGVQRFWSHLHNLYTSSY